HWPLTPARADELLRTAHRAQRVQRRSGCRDLEPVRFRAHQADHIAQAPAKKGARARKGDFLIASVAAAAHCRTNSDGHRPPLQISLKPRSFFLLARAHFGPPTELLQ